VVSAALEDWSTAPLDERLRASLGFLRKLTLEPDGVGPADVKAVRAAGVSAEALEDAIDVCALFNIIDRVADALGFEVPESEYSRRVAPGFLAGGYAEPASPLAAS
jgi:alkylhydroperoxidase family enzyme